MPTLSHPADLALADDVLRENDPDPQRILLWLRGPRDERRQHWQRLSGHLLARVVLGDGVHVTPVRLAEFRQDFRGDFRRAFDRFWSGPRQTAGRYVLPTGDWVEAQGPSRGDVLLAWTLGSDTPLDADRVARLWPGNQGCRQLGPNVFLVLGVELPPPAPPKPKADPVPKREAAPPAPASTGNGCLPDQDLQGQLEQRARQAKDLARSGRHAEALTQARQMLAWIREQRGQNHPWAATCLLLLGWLHQTRGEDEAAEPLYREALGIPCPVLGDAHPNFTTGLNNLGVLYLTRGNYADAEALHRQALRVRQATMNGTHPLVATSLNNLALVYHAQGDTTAAEPLLRQAAEMFGQTLGEAHPDVATCLENLAAFYAGLGDEAHAEAVGAQAREVREAGRGKQHVVVADTLNALVALSEPVPLPAAPPEERREPVTACASAAETTVEPDDDPGGGTEPAAPAESGAVEGLAGAVAGGDKAISDAELASWLATSSVPNYSWAEEAPVNGSPAGTGGSGKNGEKAEAAPASGPSVASAPSSPAIEPAEPEGDEPLVSPPEAEVPPVADAETGEPGDQDRPAGEEEFALAVRSGSGAGAFPIAEEPGERPDASEEDAILIDDAGPIEDWAPVADTPQEAPAASPDVEEPATPELPSFDGIDAVLAEMVPPEPPSPEGLMTEEPPESDEPEAFTRAAAGPAVPELPAPEEMDVAAPTPDPEPAALQVPLPPADEPVPASPVAEVPKDDANAGLPPPPPTNGASMTPDHVPVMLHGPDAPAAPPSRAAVPSAAERPEPVGAVAMPCESDVAQPVAEPETPAELPRAVPDFRLAEPPARPTPAPRGSPVPQGDTRTASRLHQRARECAAAGRLDEAIELLRQLPESGQSGTPADLDLALTLVLQDAAGAPGAVRAAFDFVTHRRASRPVGAAQPDAGPREIARALPADSALVELVRFRPCGLRDCGSREPARYLAFVLRAGEPDHVALVDLGDAGAVDRRVADFRAWITGEQDGERPDRVWRPPLVPGAAPPPGAALRQAVFDPLAAALAGRSRLFVAPAGNLACLPFEVLPHDDGRALHDTHQISYLTTGLDVLRFGAEASGQPGPSVVAVDPDFDLFLAASQPPGTNGPRLAGADSSPPRFERLAGGRRGGKRFAEVLGVEPWLGGAVRKGPLQELHSPRIFHLGTHCFFAEDGGDDQPGRSGVALAGANGTGSPTPVDGDNGLLTAEEIAALDLAATEVVVLSACDTGPAAAPVGENVLAVRQAFLRAGAAAVITTLWKVTDWHVKELLAEFYRRILEGEPRAEALRQAQLALGERYPDNPEYWAAFVCHGDPGPLRRPAAGTNGAPRARRWGWGRRT